MKRLMGIFLVFTFTMLAFAAKKPNIVLLMSDDVGWECFSNYSGQDYKTPNLEKLCDAGVRFEHCYSQPLCTPSRIQIMTGKYNFRNYISFGEMKRDQKTFANMLKEQGYVTCIAGKWQLGYDKNYDLPKHFGFDEHCIWNYKVRGSRYWDPEIVQNGKDLDAKGKYGPDIFSDYICDFIERNKDKQFFAYYPMVLVHDPFTPTPDSSQELKDAFSSKGKKVKGKKGKDLTAELDKLMFADMLAYMDKMIGKVYNKIESLGLAENTVFIYTSDNGTNRRITSLWNDMKIDGGKGTMRDMGNHVPFIYLHKGQVKKGTSTKDLIDFSDVYVTLAEIAGAKPEANLDGMSFLESTKGGHNKRKWVVCHYTALLGNAAGERTVRNQQYKLYEDGQFFDISKDLFEKKDLGANPESEDYKMLSKVLKSCPPLETRSANELNKAGEFDKVKTYPDWKLK